MEEKIGLISNYIPEEIIEIFGIPYRLIGNFNNTSEPDIPFFACSYIREFITAFNSDNLDFLSGVIIPQSCDSLYASVDLLQRKEKFIYRLSQPIQNTPESHEYNIKQYTHLIKFLEKQFSITFDKTKLTEIIKSGNNVRNTIRNIGQLISKERKNIPYRIFLSLILKAMQNRFKDIEIDVEEKYSEFAKYDTYSDIKRKVMLIGPIIDNFDIIDIIEDFDDTKIVFDNVTNGRRYIDGNISRNKDALEAISSYYLDKIQSPTFNNDKKYLTTIEQGAKDFGVNCIIIVNQRGCEPHSFYMPMIGEICKSKKIQFLPLDIEHNEVNLEKIKLKIHSLLEMI